MDEAGEHDIEFVETRKHAVETLKGGQAWLAGAWMKQRGIQGDRASEAGISLRRMLATRYSRWPLLSHSHQKGPP